MLPSDSIRFISFALLLLAIFLLTFSITRHSSIGIVTALLLGFIACFYLFNLGQYPAFKVLQTASNAIAELFKERNVRFK